MRENAAPPMKAVFLLTLFTFVFGTPTAAQTPRTPAPVVKPAAPKTDTTAQKPTENGLFRSRVETYTTYDEDYFYVAVVVKKPFLVGRQTAPFVDLLTASQSDDLVTVGIQREDPAGRGAARQVLMSVGVAGAAQLYRGTTLTPLKGFEDFLKTEDGGRAPFKFAVSHNGQLFATPKDAQDFALGNRSFKPNDNIGYTVELGIPWVELGGRPQTGQKMRFNVAALSHAVGSPAVMSLAPGVKSPENLPNAALWSEIVFTDAPQKTVASAPNAKVSARSFNVKPLIDGTLSEGEWQSVTAFAFEDTAPGSVVAVAPTVSGPSRLAPKVTLKKASPAPTVRPVAARLPMPRTPQFIPHLTLTLYNYDFQNDRRKALPLLPTLSDNGQSLLATHPMAGGGPWMSYDRVDWHREQLESIRRAGIDVVLPIYRADTTNKQRYSQRGLSTLASGLDFLRAAGRDYPLVGLYLDTTSLPFPAPAGANAARASMRDPVTGERLYAAIKDFYQHIPAPYRASLALSEKNGGGVANLVVLSSASPFTDFDDAPLTYCRKRFLEDFGADLLLLGGSDFKSKVKLDGYVNDTHGRGFQMDTGGWIKPASIGVGYDLSRTRPTEKNVRRSRMDGETYKSEWKQAIAKNADWVFIDGWNDYREGAEIAPSQESGMQYADLTRLFTRVFAGNEPLRVAFLSHTFPNAARAGSECSASVRLANVGAAIWTPTSYALTYQWTARGKNTPERTISVPLPTNVTPGESVTIPLLLAVPSQPGEYLLTVDVVQLGRKGDVTAVFSGLGNASLALPVSVKATADDRLPDYALTLLEDDLPRTLESGGTYKARVTLRNDGAKTWQKTDGGRIGARVLRYVSPINTTAEKEALVEVDMADASIALPNEVRPGQTVTVEVPITFRTVDGTPLPSWSPSDNWMYQLRWEYAAGNEGAFAQIRAFTLTEADFGGVFLSDRTPRQLPADKRLPVPTSLRNLGPQTWRKETTSLGYHWYYLDGTEVVWQDETTPLTEDVPPGGEVKDVLAWVTAPPFDGTYWLVWDVKIGDVWASTLPGVRPYETLVIPVDVIRGRLSFVSLDKAYNLDGVASDSRRNEGNFDGIGNAFPSEVIPPLVSGDIVPSTLWLPAKGTGVDSSRRISFRWGPKADKEKNIVQCLGQRITLAEPKKAEACRALHLLAAATADNASGGFTILFADGTEQFTSLPISRWDAAPRQGEEIAVQSPISRSSFGDRANPVSLYHYTIRIGEGKKVVALLLPKAPEIKIAAITLEKQ